MSEVIWKHTIEESDFHSFKERLVFSAIISPIGAIIIWLYVGMTVVESILAGLVLGLLLIFFDQHAMNAKDQRRYLVLTSDALKVSSEGVLLSGPEKAYRFNQLDPNTIRVTSGISDTVQLKFECSKDQVKIKFPDKKSALACLNRLRAAVEEYNK